MWQHQIFSHYVVSIKDHLLLLKKVANDVTTAGFLSLYGTYKRSLAANKKVATTSFLSIYGAYKRSLAANQKVATASFLSLYGAYKRSLAANRKE